MKKKEDKKTVPTNRKSSIRKKAIKSANNESIASKKNFRDNPAVEKLYKNVYDYKLREEAYKTAIEIYLKS